ncbi:TPA: hypothetical protein KAV78_003423 [Escherichia coli]|nr:hypothetical protein [Escherichia coli]
MVQLVDLARCVPF